ncbi:MAG TPA: hypothetical protein DCL35_00380 [Candidatus Omnitrophica bacterium]|nr:hypothetical protein [Candidatus Omnitrophota bacterium]
MEDKTDNIEPSLPQQQTALKPPLQPIDIKRTGLPTSLIIGLVLVGFIGAGLLFAVFSRPGLQKEASKQKPDQAAAIPAPSAIVEIIPEPDAKATAKSAAKQASPVPVLTLSGILFGEQGSLALINGRVVREGGLIEGARLDKVSSDRVELSFEGKKIILRSK